MKYSLDTNTCIRYLNRRSEALRQKLPTIPAREIVVCSVVRGELVYGAAKSQTPDVSVAKQYHFLEPYISLPYDDQAAFVFKQIRAALDKTDTPIGAYDLQIAAIALVHHLIVVTHNTREFSRVAGLRIEDWEV